MRTSKLALFVMAMFGVMLVMPFAMAAITWVTPVVSTNQSGTMIVNVTLTVAECGNCLNATIYYNASGGAAVDGTVLTTITNASANPVQFYSASIDISSLSDATTYNFTARLSNATTVDVANSTGVVFTIDNTNPVSTTPTITKGKFSVGSTTDIGWSASDATSGLASVVTTITSPDTNKCETQTFTSTSGTTQYTGAETDCTGTYTISTLSTDESGNTHTAEKTFKVTSAGWTADGSNTLGGSGAAGTGTGISPIVIIIAVIIIFFVVRNRK